MCINLDFVIEDLNALLNDKKHMYLVVNAFIENRLMLIEEGQDIPMIYSLFESESLSDAVKSGVTAFDIYEMTKEKLNNEECVGYFSFDSEKGCRLYTINELLIEISKSLESIAFNVLYNPFTKANQELYKRIVRVMLNAQK